MVATTISNTNKVSPTQYKLIYACTAGKVLEARIDE